MGSQNFPQKGCLTLGLRLGPVHSQQEAPVWEEGQQMPELEVRLQKLARSDVKFPNTLFQTWGGASLSFPTSLHTSPVRKQVWQPEPARAELQPTACQSTEGFFLGKT